MLWEYKSMFIVIYAKFWVGNDLAGWLGDVSTSSERPQKVQKFHFFLLKIRAFLENTSVVNVLTSTL